MSCQASGFLTIVVAFSDTQVDVAETAMNKRNVMFLGMFLTAGTAHAQTVTINAGAAAGTGLEIGKAENTVVRNSPTYVVLQGGLLFDNDQRFEVGASLLMEVEGRVGFAIEPQIRINIGSGRVRGQLIGGVPLFLAPYTLFGFSAGPGISVAVYKKLRLFSEVLFRIYPWGNDLADGSALFHTDLLLGVRHAF